MRKSEAIQAVVAEHDVAITQFQPFRSPHEGIAIILEEYEELKAEVFKKFEERDIGRMNKEAKHVAAMALRFMIDLT